MQQTVDADVTKEENADLTILVYGLFFFCSAVAAITDAAA